MTRRKAEVLTGYEVRPIPNEKSGFRFGAFSGDDLIVEAEHRSERVGAGVVGQRSVSAA